MTEQLLFNISPDITIYNDGRVTLKYPVILVTTNIIIFDTDEDLSVLLLRNPFRNVWELPGGFVEIIDKNLKSAAIRLLKIDANINITEEDLELCIVKGNGTRDSRGYSVTIVYKVDWRKIVYKQKGIQEVDTLNADKFDWFWVRGLPKMALDHKDIIKEALCKFRVIK